MCEKNSFDENSLKILSNQHSDAEIQTAYDDVKYYFTDIYEKNKFLQFDYDTLKNILSSDRLNIDDEKIVLETIKKWLTDKQINPEKNLHILLDVVRLHLLPIEYLWQQIRSYGCTDNKSLPIFLDALQYHIFPEKRSEIFIKEYKERNVFRKFLAVGSWTRESCEIIEMYDASVNKWIRLKNMDIKKRLYASIIINDTLMIIGGYQDNKGITFNTVEMIDLITGKLSNGPSMLEKRRDVNAVVANEPNPTVYVIGGVNDNGSLRSCERYDPAKKEWSPLPSMIVPRSACGCCFLNGKIYAAGGTNNGVDHNSMEVFDIKNKFWQSKAPMNNTRAICRIVASETYVYAMGGYFATFIKNPLTLVERYNPKTDSWMNVASLTSGGLGGLCSYGINGNKILFVGGAGKTVENYDEQENLWKTLAPLNYGRDGVNVLEIPGKLFNCKFDW